MENFLNTLPTTFIGWVGTAVLMTTSILFAISKIRTNDLKILRDTNKDQGDRITLLESSLIRVENCVKELQHQNKTLEDLVIVSLKQYFFENPEIAENMKEKVLAK